FAIVLIQIASGGEVASPVHLEVHPTAKPVVLLPQLVQWPHVAVVRQTVRRAYGFDSPLVVPVPAFLPLFFEFAPWKIFLTLAHRQCFLPQSYGGIGRSSETQCSQFAFL